MGHVAADYEVDTRADVNKLNAEFISLADVQACGGISADLRVQVLLHKHILILK